MIFLEKNALDCEILIGSRQSALNKNLSSNVPSFISCIQIIVFLIKQVDFREGTDITHEGIQHFLPLGPRSPTSPRCGETGDLGPRGFI